MVLTTCKSCLKILNLRIQLIRKNSWVKESVQTKNVGSRSLKIRRHNKTKKKLEEYCKTWTLTSYSTHRIQVVINNEMLNRSMRAADARRQVIETTSRRMAAKISSASPPQIKRTIGVSMASMMTTKWAS